MPGKGFYENSKAEEAYQLIKEKIIDFDYPPNMPIKELDLCEQLNMSRTPVRIAIARLSTEGFITEISPKKNVIADISVDSFISVYQIREVLDLLSVRNACYSWQNKSEIDELRRIISLQRDMLGNEKIDSRTFLRLDKDFHKYITQMARNPLLSKEISYIYDLYWRYDFYSMHVTGCQLTVSEHERIADAIEARNLDISQDWVRRHLVNVKEHTLVGIAKGFKPHDMNKQDVGYILH